GDEYLGGADVGPQVDVDDRIPVGIGVPEHGRTDDPGVGEVHIDPAEAGLGEGDEFADACDRGRVPDPGVSTRPVGGRRMIRGQALCGLGDGGGQVGEDDRGAAGDQLGGQGCADSTAGAGDDDPGAVDHACSST